MKGEGRLMRQSSRSRVKTGRVLDCGGKRSATPLSYARRFF